MLRFFVQGSAPEPYEVTAEGTGPEIVIFCRCPAGKKGGKFCKHITWILNGDVSKLVEAKSDSVVELRRRAEGSQYIAKAASHPLPEMRDQRVAGLKDLEAVHASLKAELERAGWTVVFRSKTVDSSSESISLFKSFKNGNLRKTPSWQLTYDEFTSELVYSIETGDFEETNIRARERPYGVIGPTGSLGTRKRLEDAAELFIKEVSKQQP